MKILDTFMKKTDTLTQDANLTAEKQRRLNYLNSLPATSNNYNTQGLNSSKPAQSSNDLQVLLAEAGYAKNVIDYALPKLLNEFAKITSYIHADEFTQNTIKIISTENKGLTRIKQKVMEDDVGDYQNILDYVRCSISFPTVESLFDFVKFAMSFNFKPEHFVDFKNAENLFGFPKAVSGVNNFAIDKEKSRPDQIEQYPFINDKVKLKYSEFMDYKLYIKVPLHENQYIIIEALLTIHDFIKYYEHTHVLYEVARNLSDFTTNFAINDKLLEKYFFGLIAKIHQDKVITPYNESAYDRLHLETEQGKTKRYRDDINAIPEEIQDMLQTKIIYNVGENEKKTRKFTRDLSKLLSEITETERG